MVVVGLVLLEKVQFNPPATFVEPVALYVTELPWQILVFV